MYFLKCFRSGNTLRVSLPSGLRWQINAVPGDILKIEGGQGVQWILTNASHAARLAAKREKK